MKKTVLALLIGFVVSALADSVLTVWNLSLFGWQFEANPLVHGIISLVALKTIYLALALLIALNYDKASLSLRHLFILFFILCIVGQTYGAISHVPMILAHDKAVAVQKVGSDVYLAMPDGTSQIVRSLTERERYWFYAKTIALILAWPMMLAIASFHLTVHTSKDKVKP